MSEFGTALQTQMIPAQCRAARGLTFMTESQLAFAAVVPIGVISTVEAEAMIDIQCRLVDEKKLQGGIDKRGPSAVSGMGD
jgi:hypothetical protein